MEIKVNDVIVFELSATKENVIKNDVNEDIFDDDMKRRLCYILDHKYEQCFKRLKTEWEPKLADRGITSIPLDPDAFAELVFQQEDYKSRKERDLESQQ